MRPPWKSRGASVWHNPSRVAVRVVVSSLGGELQFVLDTNQTLKRRLQMGEHARLKLAQNVVVKRGACHLHLYQVIFPSRSVSDAGEYYVIVAIWPTDRNGHRVRRRRLFSLRR